MEPAFYQSSAPSREPSPTESLDMFIDQVDAPIIRTPAQSNPQSATSQAAADAVSQPMRSHNHRKILLCLASVSTPLSMADISERTGIALSVVCFRLGKKELRDEWVQAHPKACESSAKKGLKVDGFSLTDAGRARVARSMTVVARRDP